jgi:hypothetical protein
VFTLRDLVIAQREARRNANSHPDLRDYHRARAAALAHAFGIDLERTPPSPDRGLSLIRQTTEMQLAGVASPFADFLEMPKSVDVIAQAHGPALNAAVDALHARLLDLLVDLVAQQWRVASDLSVPRAAVAASGLDWDAPGPDPLDYF